MQTLTVDLGERSYPIHIGASLLHQPAQFDLLGPHTKFGIAMRTPGNRRSL